MNEQIEYAIEIVSQALSDLYRIKRSKNDQISRTIRALEFQLGELMKKRC